MPAGRNVPKMVLLSGFRVMETGQQHKITEKLPKISFTILNRGIQIMTPDASECERMDGQSGIIRRQTYGIEQFSV